ncbi:MAG: polysaccharide export protein [Caulobacteraceae bacterium]|nr:polysaccharide export protein [Caulobacteraceae bacterium]
MKTRLERAPIAGALAVFLLLLLAARPAEAGDPAPPSMVSPTTLNTTSASSVSADYKIGPDDQLDVNVFQIGDLSRTVQVDSGGKILLPLIGQMNATGRTAGELSQDIAAELRKKYVKNPLVTVTVKDAASQRVTVDGSVLAPGIYPLPGPTTLMQAIALAKGTDPKTAQEHKVSLYRLVDGTRYGTTYDLAAIRAGRAPDPQVYGRDIIIVPGSGMKTLWHEFLNVAPIIAWAHP